MSEAALAREKLDLLCDHLRSRYHVDDPVWRLIDDVYNDLDCLEKQAYLFIPKPSTLWRRLRGATA